MEIPVRAKDRVRTEALYSSYGDLAGRLLPMAVHIAFYGAAGDLKWPCGGSRITDPPASLLEDILCRNLEPRCRRLSRSTLAVTIPISLDGKAVSILQVHVAWRDSASDQRVMRDTIGAAAPLVDCLCRELGSELRKTPPSATLSERTEELEWLFALTENLHSNSSHPRAISHLLGAAVERMRANFGAVVAPKHELELRYESMVRIDAQSTGMFERCRPYFLSYVLRRKRPLVANRTAGSTMQPFKVLLLPIEPRKGQVIGYLVFLKTAALSGFGRRQQFLGRHVGHQIGTLLESQYDLATGLLTRKAFEQDVRRLIAARREHADHSLLYFDIDRLHVINDALGFGMGDEAIVKVAELLHPPSLPDAAVASRLGGDSFLVYLPDHDAERAAAYARLILRSAAGCSVGPEQQRIALSLSCGVVRIGPVHGLGGPIAAARSVCAGCKKSGGNRVGIHFSLDAASWPRESAMFPAY